MTHNIEIAQACDRLREESESTTGGELDVPPPAVDAPARVDETGVVSGLAIAAIRLFHHRLHLQPEMVSALAVVLCAMPGLALYRISTSVSRGMKVMRHDIFSRGMTEPIATTLAFLIVFIIGL